MAKIKTKRQKRQELKKAHLKKLNPLLVFDQKQTWLIGFLIALPFIQSKTTIDPNISIRFQVQAIFTGVYILYFYILRRNKIKLVNNRLLGLVFLLSFLFLVWTIATSLAVTNSAEAIYEISRFALNLTLMSLAFLAIMENDFKWSRFASLMVLTGIIHSLIGFDQLFQWGITDFRGNGEPFGIMTNRNLYGSFLALLFGYTFYASVRSNPSSRWISVFGLVIVILAIIYSQTRSSWISTGMMVLCFGSFLIVYRLIARQLLIRTISFLALAVIIGFFTYSSVKNYGKTPSNPTSIRQEKTNESNGGQKVEKPKVTSTIERLVVWQETLMMIQEHPITGVGSGNWKLEIPNYNLGGTRSEFGQIVRIRAHNLYLQQFAETGILGFLLFFTPWFIILLMALKVIRFSSDPSIRLVTLMLLALLVGFATDSFFSFGNERIANSVHQWFAMGGVLGCYALFILKEKDGDKYFELSVPKTILMTSFALGISLWCVFLGTEKHRFETHMNRARALYVKGKYHSAITEVNKGQSNYVSLEINNDPIELVAALSHKKLKEFEAGLKMITTAEKYNPNSTRIMNTKAAILTDMKKHKEAISYYQEALRYSPRHNLSLKNMALNYYFLEEYDSCLSVIQRVSEKDEFTSKLIKASEARIKAKIN